MQADRPPRRCSSWADYEWMTTREFQPYILLEWSLDESQLSKVIVAKACHVTDVRSQWHIRVNNFRKISNLLQWLDPHIVCLLNLKKTWELFILGVQANKLHFCDLEMILNKTGYSHIMENQKFFFHFSTWELVEKNSTLLVFLNFLRNPPKIFRSK